ncbi:MAG: rhodanese-like domain-containing protein [Legionellales bacterium]|nr:rhodanese-like domain-containing protein [Legionellales bacterium]
MNLVSNVSAKILQKWLEKDEAVLIDVREPIENRTISIKSAINMPLSQVEFSKINIPEHKNKKLVFHCKSGKRSMMACKKILADNIEYDIWNLEGGIIAWEEAGLPVIIPDKKIISIDRQLHISMGMLIIIGMTLGYLYSQAWFILPTIIGLGLLNSGITGWCGFAKLLTKMPWNK